MILQNRFHKLDFSFSYKKLKVHTLCIRYEGFLQVAQNRLKRALNWTSGVPSRVYASKVKAVISIIDKKGL